MNFVGKSTSMIANLRCRYGTAEMPAQSVEARITAFLDGESGADLLHALYDHVLFEPMPSSMRAILKTQQAGGR